MILPMCVSAPRCRVRCQSVGAVMSVSVGGVAAGDRDQRRAQDPVAEAVAPLELGDDLAVGPARCRGRWRRLRARAGRTARPTASIGRHALALEQRAQLAVDGARCPRPRRCRRARPAWRSSARSKSSASGQDLAEQRLAGQPELASRSSLGAPLEVGEVGGGRAAGRRRCSAGLRPGPRRARRGSCLDLGQQLRSGSASRARRCAPRRGCDAASAALAVVVGHRCRLAQAYRWSTSSFISPRHEAHRADRLGVGHAGRAEHADDADGAAGPAVRGQDERHVLHLRGPVLAADEDLDAAGAGHAPHQRRRGRPGSRGRAKTRRSFSLWANSGAAITLSRPSLKTSSTAAASNSRIVRTMPLADPAERAPVGVGVARGSSRRERARRSRRAVRPAEQLVEQAGDAVEVVLVGRAASRVSRTCLIVPFAQDEDEAGQPVAGSRRGRRGGRARRAAWPASPGRPRG